MAWEAILRRIISFGLGGRYNTLTLYLLGHSKVTDAFSINTRLFYRWFDNFLENWRQIDDSAYDDHSVGGILTFQYDFTKDINLALISKMTIT